MNVLTSKQVTEVAAGTGKAQPLGRVGIVIFAIFIGLVVATVFIGVQAATTNDDIRIVQNGNLLTAEIVNQDLNASSQAVNWSWFRLDRADYVTSFNNSDFFASSVCQNADEKANTGNSNGVAAILGSGIGSSSQRLLSQDDYNYIYCFEASIISGDSEQATSYYGGYIPSPVD